MPEKNSSSQNGNRVTQTVQRIIPGTSGEFVKIELSGGPVFFVSIETSFRLRIGQTVDENSIENLADESDSLKCRWKVLELLGLREHTRYQLLLKLRKRGFPDRIITPVLNLLEERGAIDDLRFTENWLRLRMKKHPEGRDALFSGLFRAGVSRQIAERVIRGEIDDKTEDEALFGAMEKLNRRRDMSPDKLKRALLRRGFPLSKISRYIRDIPQETD